MDINVTNLPIVFDAFVRSVQKKTLIGKVTYCY